MTKNTTLHQPRISIIALGPVPPRRFQMPGELAIRDGAKKNETQKFNHPVLLTALAYHTPPIQSFLKPEGDKKWISFDVRFNSQGLMKEVPTLKGLKFFPEITSDNEAPTMFDVPPLMTDSHTLCFLTPVGTQQPLWKSKPLCTLVPISWPSRGETRIILVNISNQVINISSAGNKNIVLKSSSKKSIDFKNSPTKSFFHLRVKGETDSDLTIRESIQNLSNFTKVYTFYEANPMTNGGRKIGLFRGCYKAPK